MTGHELKKRISKDGYGINEPGRNPFQLFAKRICLNYRSHGRILSGSVVCPRCRCGGRQGSKRRPVFFAAARRQKALGRIHPPNLFPEEKLPRSSSALMSHYWALFGFENKSLANLDFRALLSNSFIRKNVYKSWWECIEDLTICLLSKVFWTCFYRS